MQQHLGGYEEREDPVGLVGDDRLDATHAMIDDSQRHFLAELTDRLPRPFPVLADEKFAA